MTTLACAINAVIDYIFAVGDWLQRNNGIFSAAFAGAVAYFTWRLAWLTKDLWVATKASAEAAKRAADIAEKALTSVERPILSVTMPKEMAIPDGHVFDPSAPIYAVVVQNVGKQIAVLLSGNAEYRIQNDSTVSPPVALGQPDGAACHVRIIGEVPIRPGATPYCFLCQRSAPLTVEEKAGLEDLSLWGFFRISLIYADPIGTLRNCIFIFADRNYDNVEPGFVQAHSVDSILSKATADQHRQAQRKLVGDLLKFYRETAK